MHRRLPVTTVLCTIFNTKLKYFEQTNILTYADMHYEYSV